MLTSKAVAICTFVVTLTVAATYGKDAYRQKGVLSDMQSVQCGMMQKSGSTVAGALITGAQHSKTQDLLCQEYTLKTDRVTYRIRPRDEKHPVLLPVGEEAEFRLKKDKMILRIPELDNKDREYQVLSMTATSELSQAIEKTKHPPKPHRQELSVDEESTTPAGREQAMAPADSSDSSSGPVLSQPAGASTAPNSRPEAVTSGFVLVQSTPTGAQIFVDSALAGRTPSTLKLKPGVHSVQVVLGGYKDFVANIDVLAGAQQQLTATLTR